MKSMPLMPVVGELYMAQDQDLLRFEVGFSHAALTILWPRYDKIVAAVSLPKAVPDVESK